MDSIKSTHDSYQLAQINANRQTQIVTNLLDKLLRRLPEGRYLLHTQEPMYCEDHRSGEEHSPGLGRGSRSSMSVRSCCGSFLEVPINGASKQATVHDEAGWVPISRVKAQEGRELWEVPV